MNAIVILPDRSVEDQWNSMFENAKQFFLSASFFVPLNDLENVAHCASCYEACIHALAEIVAARKACVWYWDCPPYEFDSVIQELNHDVEQARVTYFNRTWSIGGSHASN
jgi:hypothetical protein